MLEQVVRAVEVGPQPPDRGRPVLARERLLRAPPEELPVDADQEAGGDPRVALVDAELRRIAPASTWAKRAITSSSFACSAGDSSMIRANVANAGLQSRGHSLTCRRRSAPRTDSPGLTPADRLDERRLTLRHLVEEEIFLGREVVEDRLLGDAGRSRDLGDGDAGRSRACTKSRIASSAICCRVCSFLDSRSPTRRSVTQFVTVAEILPCL